MTQKRLSQSSGAGANGSAGRNAGRLFIVSAPSGAGKTTLCEAVRNHFNDLAYSVSFTTRARRKGERQAVDYYFISRKEFERGIGQNRWAEWAEVHGNYYGTSGRWIARNLEKGAKILLDIDVQGMHQLLKRFPQAVTIFIAAPSLEELRRRLEQRGTDDTQTIELRMANAEAEMAQQDHYRHIVVNDDLADARQQLISILNHYMRS
jgi:guanylate kinase